MQESFEGSSYSLSSYYSEDEDTSFSSEGNFENEFNDQLVAYYGIYNEEKGKFELVPEAIDPTYRILEVSSKQIHVVKSKRYDYICWAIYWDPDRLGKELPPEIYNHEPKWYTLPPSKLNPAEPDDDFDRVIWFPRIPSVREDLFLVYRDHQLIRIIEQTSPEYTTWYIQTPSEGKEPVIVSSVSSLIELLKTRYQVPIEYRFYPYSKYSVPV